MIVRWGLDSLPEACAEAGVSSPLLVASPRWDALELAVAPAAGGSEVPTDRIAEASPPQATPTACSRSAAGARSTSAKAISAASGLPLVSVPTTYAGAEWTTYFGVRDPERRMRGGGGGAHPAAIVYEPELTLGLPRGDDRGDGDERARPLRRGALRAGPQPGGRRACARGRAPHLGVAAARRRALRRTSTARTELLRGACHAGAALAGSMLALAHAMAQAVGGRYGLPHGTLNGITLPPALRFNAAYAPDAVRRFGEAIGAPDDPAGRVEQLAALSGLERLRELGVPEEDLPALAVAAAQRGGNQANPKPATPEEIEQLLREMF